MNKKDTRKQILERRRALTAEEVRDKSQKILENFLQLFDRVHHRSIHIFLSIEKFREIDTRLFVERLQAISPEVEFAVPRVDGDSGHLTHHLYRPEQLVFSRWGIAEPPLSAPRLSPEQFDLVVVPMLAFDEQGHRLGYGAGYYDKFLALVRPDTLKVGVCFELGRLAHKLPFDHYDVKLDWIVTEEQVMDKRSQL